MSERTRTISIRGMAEVVAPSDITVVKARVSGKAKTFEEALRELAKSTKKLKDAIEDAGLDRKALKTTDLKVERHFKKVKDGTDNYNHTKYKDVPDGFDYSESISFEFPNDNDVLSKSVMNIIDCKVEPRIVFYFRSSQYEDAKNEALAKAAQNARREAELIVTSAGGKLGKLLSVSKDSYRHYERDYYRENEILCCNNMVADDIDFEVEPEDENVSQTVEMVWEIED